MRNLSNCVGASAGWDAQFSTSRRGMYYDAHKTWIEWYVEARRTDDEDEDADSQNDPTEEFGETSIMQAFMRGSQGSYICHLEAMAVENFCDSALLKSLRTGKLNDHQNHNIWYAGTCTGATESAELPPQWLTPETFYHKFSKHCIGAQDVPGASGPAHIARVDYDDAGAPSSSAKHNIETQFEPADDRTHRNQQGDGHHLIFVSDLDPLSFCALIGTASCLLASPLGKILYNHLISVTSIDIETRSNRFLTFQLSFSLPYYAWRDSPEPCNDRRRTKAHEPVRRFKDVSLLSLEPDKTPAFLYEAQTSCVVAGFDEWSWTAHCLADTYFDGDAGENVHQYSRDATDGVHTNPFCFGQTEAERPIHKAREFFLRVLAIRLNLVKEEWQNVVTNIKESVSKYEDNHYHPLVPSLGTGDTRRDEEEIRISFDWVNAVMSIATTLTERLSNTIDAGARFMKHGAVNFQDSHNINLGARTLQSIQTAIHDLGAVETDLEAITKRCREFRGKLEFRLQLEALHMGNCQGELVRDNNKLAKTTQTLSTIMMLYVSPIAMTAGIFSTQENIIPFLPQNLVSFMSLTTAFGIAGYIFLKYQDEPVTIWEKLQTSAENLPWGNVIRFFTVCTETLHVLLRPTGIYGTRARAIWAEMVHFTRVPQTDLLTGIIYITRIREVDSSNLANYNDPSMYAAGLTSERVGKLHSAHLHLHLGAWGSLPQNMTKTF
ncbi:hypothetical protein PV11_08851 [Exophiala sideris]|uniref:Uncharacterized protein n=1 Tax=Exophiala sideris TaxID=1016849 RepID=A0A0D1WPM9_9EURO|nr:hypothetical protein PV11_08851 [Exophiala sideris]